MLQSLLILGHKLIERSIILGSDHAAISELGIDYNRMYPGLSEHTRTLFYYDMRFAMDWARCGFPQVTIGHKLAASFMATSIGAEAVSDVAFPWPSFALRVPGGLVQFKSVNGDPWEPEAIWVHPHDATNATTIAFRSGRESLIMRGALSVADLASHPNIESVDCRGDDMLGSLAEHVTAWNDRAILLLDRLLLGCCIELDQPVFTDSIGKGRPAVKRRKDTDPKAWTFTLGRTVQVDCREWVSSYLNDRRGTTVSVQSLVRGHHKRQRCGPGGSARKWIHIEPYWRGPEDAPIAVRSHNLATK